MSGLHFIEQQQETVLVAKLSQAKQIFPGRDRDSALSLHRLDENRAGLGRNCASHGFDIVERNVFESFHRGIESLFNFLLTGGRNSRQRPTVK